MKRFTLMAATGAVLLTSFMLAGPAHAQSKPKPKKVDFAKQVAPVIEKFCVPCHSGDPAPDGVKITKPVKESWAKKEARMWRKCVKEMQAKTMPPKGNPAPTAAQIKAVADWTAQNLPAKSKG